MRVSLIVATYGPSSWAERGLRALAAAQEVVRPHEAIPVHDAVLSSLQHARNTAALGATGDWLLFLDADDELEPGYLDAMSMATLLNWPDGDSGGLCRTIDDPPSPPPRPMLLVPAIRYVSSTGRAAAGPLVPAWPAALIDTNCACIGTLIPRQLFVDLGGFRVQLAGGRRLDSLEDWDLWLRAVKAGARMVAVPRAVYRAQAGARRNADQTPYQEIRAEHGPGFDWWDVAAYKHGEASAL